MRTLATRPFRYSWAAARSDLIAGATVAAIAVPQAIAYALIAGVDPRYGLYSAIVITVVASVLGSSNHVINGPTNAISLVVFSALAPLAGTHDVAELLFLLGIVAGTIQILIGVLKLGDLTRYVSESVILGFMAGAGFLIALGQVGNFIGAAKKGTGDQSVLVNTWLTLSQGIVNPLAVGLGLGTVAVVLVTHRLVKKYKLPRIEMLVGLILASLVAARFGWSLPGAGANGTTVSVVGAIPAALPAFHIPQIRVESIGGILKGALAVALLGLLEALAVAKSIATYTRQPLDYNRQCLAEGVGNVVGGFFRSLPGSGSLTRSAINYQAGAITRASGIYSGIIVAVVVLLLGPYARFIPKSVLAGLLFVTAARLIDWKRLGYAIRASRFDAALVAVTAFTAIFIDVEDSILVGVAVSILWFVLRASKPRRRELVVSREGLIRERRPGEERGSLLIYDLEGELFFGAAPEWHRYLDDILAETERSGTSYVVLRLKRTSNPDVVVAEHLERFLREASDRSVTVLLAGVRPDLLRILENVGVTKWFPQSQIFPEEAKTFSATSRAVRYAVESARSSHEATASFSQTIEFIPTDETEPAYHYLT